MGALTKIRHKVLGCPLSVIIEGLRSQDSDTRVAAADNIRFVKVAERADFLSAATPALTDPVPAVRFHAIRSFTQHDVGREELTRLLVSTSDSDAHNRDAVLADLARINSPESPFYGWGAAALHWHRRSTSQSAEEAGNLFCDALIRTTEVPVTLPILEAAAMAEMIPWVYTRWPSPVLEQDSFTKLDWPKVLGGPWPDRCCACGAPHPADIEEVPFSGTISENLYSGGSNQLNAEGTLPVPVCANALCHKQPRAHAETGVGLIMHFASPQFVAELLELRRFEPGSGPVGSWRVISYTKRGVLWHASTDTALLHAQR